MIDVEKAREIVLQIHPKVEECFPFDEVTLVFKIGGKMFGLISLEQGRMNLKCDPEKALELREYYGFVLPGYHMNKKHWNTILLEQSSNAQITEWIQHSFDLVVASLTKKQRLETFG